MDVSKLKSLGFTAQISLDEGIKQMIKYYQDISEQKQSD